MREKTGKHWRKKEVRLERDGHQSGSIIISLGVWRRCVARNGEKKQRRTWIEQVKERKGVIAGFVGLRKQPGLLLRYMPSLIIHRRRRRRTSIDTCVRKLRKCFHSSRTYTVNGCETLKWKRGRKTELRKRRFLSPFFMLSSWSFSTRIICRFPLAFKGYKQESSLEYFYSFSSAVVCMLFLISAPEGMRIPGLRNSESIIRSVILFGTNWER